MSPLPGGCWDPVSCTPSSCTLSVQGEGLGWGAGAVTEMCGGLRTAPVPSDHIHRWPGECTPLSVGCPLWPGQAASSQQVPASTMSLYSAGDGGAGLRGRRTPRSAHAFCWGCVPWSMAGITKYLKLETGFWMCGAPGKLHPPSA